MSYCLNPDCRRPQNPTGTKFCQSCGSKLLLQQRYRTLKLIGQGGFGRTFLAVDEDQPSKPRCVIKQFFPQTQGINNAQKAAELFKQEAVRLEELGKHPQIPQFLAHFEQDNRQYLVQEFIDGQNLAQVLKAEGAFNEAQIRDLLNTLLPVLEFIHSHNVIHRDIKPENIIRRTPPTPPTSSLKLRLAKGGEEGSKGGEEGSKGGEEGKAFILGETGGGQWVLVDFGAAKNVTGTALARTGTVIGSAGYAAPEQAGGKAVFSSDLYSLGVTCIHLLTQTEPFDLYSFSEATWVWRDYLSRPVSRQLRLVLDKMVEIATGRRFQSASEVLNALNSPLNLGTRTPRVTPTKRAIASPQAASPRVRAESQPQMQNWRCVQTLKGHTDSIRSLAISPDGDILASASDDKTIKLWQLATGQELCTIKAHSKSVCSVAMSADGEILASGSDDKSIKLWQLSTGLQIGSLTLGGWFSGDSGCVYSVAIAPDGQILASLSNSGAVKLWNLKTGQEIQRLKGDTSWIHAIAISPDGQTLAGGSGDSIKLWNLKTGRGLRILRGHTSWVRTVAISPDGQTLASGSDDATIKLWDLSTGRELYSLRGHTRAVYSVAFSPVGERPQASLEEIAVSASKSASLAYKQHRRSNSEDFSEEATAAKRVKSNQKPGVGLILASSSDDQIIKLWDVSTGQELCTLAGHTSWVHAVAFSPDGQTLVSGSGDSIIKIWQCDIGDW